MNMHHENIIKKMGQFVVYNALLCDITRTFFSLITVVTIVQSYMSNHILYDKLSILFCLFQYYLHKEYSHKFCSKRNVIEFIRNGTVKGKPVQKVPKYLTFKHIVIMRRCICFSVLTLKY